MDGGHWNFYYSRHRWQTQVLMGHDPGFRYAPSRLRRIGIHHRRNTRSQRQKFNKLASEADK